MDSPAFSGKNRVKLNVGGKTFETTLSLITQHDGCMLARLVSDTWIDDSEEAVFIDRDGDLFAHVLNYLRYGSITLPNTVPKDMFLRELDFYGINTEEGTVKTYCEGWAETVTKRHESIRKMEEEKTRLMKENDIEYLAHYCANFHLNHKLNLTGNVTSISFGDSINNGPEEKRLWDAVNSLHIQCNKELFKLSLSKFGLILEEVTEVVSRKHTYHLTLKTL